MDAATESLDITKGLSLRMSYQLDAVDITNHEIKFTIFNCMANDANYEITEKDSIEKPTPLTGFFDVKISSVDSALFNSGTKSYQFVMAIKEFGKDWDPLVHGKIKVFDPAVSYV